MGVLFFAVTRIPIYFRKLFEQTKTNPIYREIAHNLDNAVLAAQFHGILLNSQKFENPLSNDQLPIDNNHWYFYRIYSILDDEQ